VSTLDLLGPGLTLLTGPRGSAWHACVAEVATPLPLVVHSVDAAAAAAFDIGACGAVLVRPDGQLAGRWQSTVDLRSAVEAARGATALVG